MRAELKKKWIEALRSGKYKQTKGVLRNESGFCCLGVLCDISGEEWEPGSDGEFYAKGMSSWSVISGDLRAELGPDENVCDDVHDKLTDMNDYGSSFEEIADWIEENI